MSGQSLFTGIPSRALKRGLGSWCSWGENLNFPPQEDDRLVLDGISMDFDVFGTVGKGISKEIH